ncbi:GFA family protein [Mesorhizobium sp. LjRoot246]|uniref:GFA family protein n=1 Tax=Mesorhizobium sp. LjRoot246 TaxID=3342294 RepID=UPI003ECD720A
MKTRLSRREVMAVATLAFVDSAVTGSTTAQAATQTPEASAVKTRTASCICGQLTLTCVGPDPERISLCHCINCQKQTGSAFAIQATFPKEQVTIRGKSTTWTFPVAGAPPVTYRNCSRTGATFHFCPECGSTVYYVLAETPDNIGIKVGAFADPTFPPPMISGFEEYRFPWAMNVEALPMPGGHHT